MNTIKINIGFEMALNKTRCTPGWHSGLYPAELLAAAKTADPNARLYNKARVQAERLCQIGHVSMENRNGLAVDATLIHATGTAEREAAPDMLSPMNGGYRMPLGAGKANETADFFSALRDIRITPHVA